jgi:hypothetical protein
MFTNQIIDGPLLLLASAGILGYWRLLGSGFDARIFLALNFSLITIWAFISKGDISLRLAALIFIGLFVLSYWTSKSKRLAGRIDGLLCADLSTILFLLSCVSIFLNIQSGLTLLDERAILLEQAQIDPMMRYRGYVLMASGFITAHVICTAALQSRWKILQILAIGAAAAAAVTSLSKASFLPILLTYLFVYAKRIGPSRLSVLLISSGFLALLLIQRLYEDLQLSQVAEILFQRIVLNVDVLDYIEELGPIASLKYPYASPFYFFWPAFQFTQDNFTVPGWWLHGTLFDDWRGFGPNPTFVGDLLLASMYVGVIFAPLFGKLLRVADRSGYRVFIALICYSFLQDWYLACLNFAVFSMILLLSFLFTKLSNAILPRGWKKRSVPAS